MEQVVSLLKKNEVFAHSIAAEYEQIEYLITVFAY